MLRALSLLPAPVRRHLIRRKLRFDDDEVRGLTAEVACSANDALAAARIVHDAYVARGLVEPHSSRVRVTPAQILPSSFVIVAKRAGEVIGTISLQVDGALGLPLDRACPAVLSALRATRPRVAEVGALAIRREHRHNGVLHLLNRAMFGVAESVGVTDLVVGVSAWAADLYAAVLGFVPIAEFSEYPGLATPIRSLALRLPLDDARARLRTVAPASHRVYVERAWPEITIAPSLSIDAHDEARLEGVRALVAARRDVFRSLARHEVTALRRVVPEIYWTSPSQIDPRELASLDASLQSVAS